MSPEPLAPQTDEMSLVEAELADQVEAGANWMLRIAITWLVIVAVITVLGEWLPFVTDPNERDRELIEAGPSWSHWFGNAKFGQDVFSRVVVGGRISLFVALVATFVSTVIGGGLGIAAGYLRGQVDTIVRFIINVSLSIPALLLVIFIVAVRGQSLFNVILAVTLLGIPAMARIVRTSTLQIADRDYVRAAEVIGATKGSILRREVLPNVMPTLISFAFLSAGIILVGESTLSFLGLSVEAPTITWGSIISEGRLTFADTPHMVFLPSLVLLVTVMALNLVGDQLLKRYDIREAAL